MPAPKSILERMNHENGFMPVDVSIQLYKKVVAACLKMPKRYTYLLLQQVINLAGEVMDNAKMANSVFPTNQHEVQIRRDYWIKARASLQALSTRVDRFLEVPGTLTYQNENTGRISGITVNELAEIADLIEAEQQYLTNALKREQNRFKDLR